MMKNNTHFSDFLLTFGGGAARGFAHIGVFRFLEDHFLIPREVSGTSMGAIVAASVALGKTTAEMEDFVRNFRLFDVIDFIPNGRIMNPAKVRKKLELFLGDYRFSNTKIPLKIVAVSLKTGKIKIFTHGSILDAVMASIALP